MFIPEDERVTLCLTVFTDDSNPEVLDRLLHVPSRRVVHRGEQLGPAHASRKNKWEYEVFGRLADADLIREQLIATLLDQRQALEGIAGQYDIWVSYNIDSKENRITYSFSSHQVRQISSIGLCWCVGFDFHADHVNEAGKTVRYAPDFYEPDFPDLEASARFTLRRHGARSDVVEVVKEIYDEWTEPLERFVCKIAELEYDPRDELCLGVEFWTNSDQMGFHLAPQLLTTLSRHGLGLEITVVLCLFKVVFPDDCGQSN